MHVQFFKKTALRTQVMEASCTSILWNNMKSLTGNN